MNGPLVIIDECMPAKINEFLSSVGYKNVLRLKKGCSDIEVKNIAKENGAYIITKDQHFNGNPRAIVVGERDLMPNIYMDLVERILETNPTYAIF
jgi:predicted nuclease of predicted toxin-antitoxin system